MAMVTFRYSLVETGYRSRLVRGFSPGWPTGTGQSGLKPSRLPHQPGQKGAHVAAAEGEGVGHLSRIGTNNLLPRQRFGLFLCRGREFILAHFVAAAEIWSISLSRQRIN